MGLLNYEGGKKYFRPAADRDNRSIQEIKNGIEQILDTGLIKNTTGVKGKLEQILAKPWNSSVQRDAIADELRSIEDEILEATGLEK